jgi:hypothetical protein
MDVATKADRAAQVLANEVYQEAVAGAKQRLKDSWAAADDPVQRDALWHELKAIDAVTRELTIIRDNGIVARHRHDKEATRA